jgi:hypothetical protein
MSRGVKIHFLYREFVYNLFTTGAPDSVGALEVNTHLQLLFEEALALRFKIKIH